MAHTYAVVLAGGRGLRLNDRLPKQFLPLGSRPVIVWSLEAFDACEEIDHIIAVLPGPYLRQAEQVLESHSISKLLKLVAGGETRQESALNALASHPFNDDDILLFHDAARPFVTPRVIRACVNFTVTHGAAGVYVPVQDTIAEIHEGFVATVPSRDALYYAQTPQGFRYSVIHAAHQAARRDGIAATDDVSLVRAAGFDVIMVEGDYSNFKITTESDYQSACRYAESNNKIS